MTTFLDLLKKRSITVSSLASELDVSVSQIYYWNRHGISANNKHYFKLKQIVPEIIPKEITVKKNGEEDTRYKAGRKKKQLKLTDTDLSENNETEFKSSLFPKIHMNKKTT